MDVVWLSLAETNRRLRVRSARALVALCMAFGWMAGAGAEASGQSASDPPPAAEAAAAAAPEAESGEKAATDGSFLSKITFHGYLSQAYAVSNGNQVVGISKQGTSDYRTAALQIRAAMTDDDAFLIQLSHERNGVSPIQAVHSDVELDWLFYQHDFGESAVKVGRIPIPFGIYNEVRDVGTVLPLYRPARPIYEETSFATETVDGLVLSHSFSLGRWQLGSDVHYGDWTSFDNLLRPVRSYNSGGLEFWLDTPLPGLRVGVGGMRFDSDITSPTTTQRLHRQLSHFSVDGEFARFNVQVEVKRDSSQHFSGGQNTSVWAGYAHLGVFVTKKLMAHGEYEYIGVKFPATENAKDYDRAFALSYFFRKDLVLKAEIHREIGWRIEGRPGLIPGRPVPNYRTDYGILSLSTSF
jgi:hypothetical protein